jgi:hypothetical protein
MKSLLIMFPYINWYMQNCAVIYQCHYEMLVLPSVSSVSIISPICRIGQPIVLPSINAPTNYLCCHLSVAMRTDITQSEVAYRTPLEHFCLSPFQTCSFLGCLAFVLTVCCYAAVLCMSLLHNPMFVTLSVFMTHRTASNKYGGLDKIIKRGRSG